MPDYQIYRIDTLPPSAGDAALLDPFEQEIYAKKGLPYLLERSVLKREIGRRLGLAAADVHLSIGAQGKPHIPGIHFNMSHSAGLLCIAFHDTPVGVDIEFIRPRPHLDKLAARIMAPEQLGQFIGRGCPIGEFFACWCSAEALVKQAGLGLGCAKRFPFLYNGDTILLGSDTMPTVQLFSPAPGFQGAIAY